MLLAVKTLNVISAFRSVLCHSLTVVTITCRKLILVCQICEKIFSGNVGFGGEEKLGYLKKKKAPETRTRANSEICP